jgi:superfamily II DNA or RNA helicase
MNKPANLIGYIYIRNHPAYDLADACKLGKSNNIPERDTQYATGEIKRGYFDPVFEVPIQKLGFIERLLQYEFCHQNIKYNAGTEFYNKKIITLIEPYLLTLGVNYRKLSKEEINDLIRTNRVKATMSKINIRSLIHILKTKKNEKDKSDEYILTIHTTQPRESCLAHLPPPPPDEPVYSPRDYQQVIIDKAHQHLQTNDKGLIIIPCGVGKTLISLWITQKCNSNTILIGVPNKLILQQWKEVVRTLFQRIPYLIVSGEVNTDNIIRFLQNNRTKCIVITTYSSSHKLYTATQNTSFKFDMKINDEVHHLTTTNISTSYSARTYIQMLKIPASKQLSLTATLKHLESSIEDSGVVSNNNVEYFGDIIDRKSLLWAINENITCDYVVQTITTDEEKLEEHLAKFCIIDDNDKRLFLGAFASLKSVYEGHSHHLLIYSNSVINSLKLVQYIKLLLDDSYFHMPGLYYSDYDGGMNVIHQTTILTNFKKAKTGIIACVYCLGEGVDLPLLDAVVFAENMTSNIRIVQSALRASRKDALQPNKINKIILPILNRDDWLDNNENQDLKKVREVIYQMGMEDETITQKIKVFKIDIKKQKPRIKEKQENTAILEFGEYNEELTRKLRLKITKRTALATSYEKAKRIIVDKNIKSKEDYYKLCDKDIRLSKDPELIYKGHFTNWIDYLNIGRIYYDLETCKHKIDEYLTVYPDIKKDYLELSLVSGELCKIDVLFPPVGLWVEYYNVKDLRDIITIVNKKKRKSGIVP